MISLNQLAIATKVDLSKINPNLSDFDTRIAMANQVVDKWLKDSGNWSYLNNKKAEYIHTKGWTSFAGKKGHLKHEVDIPQEAFVLLPSEIRNNPKELMKWVKSTHPYLLHS